MFDILVAAGVLVGAGVVDVVGAGVVEVTGASYGGGGKVELARSGISCSSQLVK